MSNKWHHCHISFLYVFWFIADEDGTLIYESASASTSNSNSFTNQEKINTSEANDIQLTDEELLKRLENPEATDSIVTTGTNKSVDNGFLNTLDQISIEKFLIILLFDFF